MCRYVQGEGPGVAAVSDGRQATTYPRTMVCGSAAWRHQLRTARGRGATRVWGSGGRKGVGEWKAPHQPAAQEWPNSADDSSVVAGTEPESGEGRRGKGSTRVSSMTGEAGRGGLGMTAASE